MNKKISLHTHPIYLDHDTGQHPEQPGRIEAIESALAEDTALLEKIEKHLAEPVSDEAILTCHTQKHLDRLKSCRGRRGRIDADTVYSEDSMEAVWRAAGGVCQAIDRVVSRDVYSGFALGRPPGHHATTDQAMGFCFVNNVAVAARHAQTHGIERVVIIDFDVHHGNGTQDIFYQDPSVFFYSLHLHPHYPGTGKANETGYGDAEGTTLNRPLPMGYDAQEYAELYERDLDKILEEFKPEFALISAGFDSHRQDPLGGLRLEDEDFYKLTQMVCQRWPGKVVSTLEGGYNLSVLGGAVREHVRALAE